DFFLEAESMHHGTPCNAYSFVRKGQIKIDKNKLRKYGIKEGPHLKGLKAGKNMTYNGKKYLAKNLTFSEKEKKISFVLDTEANERISNFVKNSDAFVCEASYSDELRDLANRNHHMTALQAAKAAKNAKAGKLFLVHISQRYEKNPGKILNEAKKAFKNSFIPRDLDSFEV
ncbi:MAG: hypothetical protein AABX79_02545, partial [Nanoarchaeota archaeon]